MNSLSVSEFVQKIKSGELSVVEHTHKVIEEIERTNKKFSHFCFVSKDTAFMQAKELEKKIKANQAKGSLVGVPLSVKDSICVKDVHTRAGSKVLTGFIPPSNATCVQKAVDQGAVVVGKTSQDEFGFGSYSVNIGVGFETPKHPLDVERSCGGSSGGSAAFTALSNFTHVSFGEETNGSIVVPSSFCGVVGITPTYGRISRSGVIDYANSLDKIGPVGKTVEDAALLLEAASGHDEKDFTSSPKKADLYSQYVGQSIRGKTIGVVKEFSGEGLDKGVEKIFFEKISMLEKEGAKIKEVSLELNAEYSIPVYYLLSTSEVSTNLAKFCGMRYGMQDDFTGSFDEYFSHIRSTGFGMEVKRRLILGTFCRMSGFRDAYYLRAAKVRAKMLTEFLNVFKQVDLVANPTVPFVARRFSEISKLTPVQHYYTDLYTGPANLAGLPHITVDAGLSNGFPVGIMFTAPHFEEKELIKAASFVEDN